MTWPFMQAMGDWGDPAGPVGFLRIDDWCHHGGDQRHHCMEKPGVDAFIVTLGAMLGFRGIVFMFNGEQTHQPPELDIGRFRRSAVSGPAHRNMVPAGHPHLCCGC